MKPQEITILAAALLGLLAKRKESHGRRGSRAIPQEPERKGELTNPLDADWEQEYRLKWFAPVDSISREKNYYGGDGYSLQIDMLNEDLIRSILETSWGIEEFDWRQLEAADYHLDIRETDSRVDLGGEICDRMREDKEFLDEIIEWKLARESTETEFTDILLADESGGARSWSQAVYQSMPMKYDDSMLLHEALFAFLLERDREGILRRLAEIDPDEDSEWADELASPSSASSLTSDILEFLYDQGQFHQPLKRSGHFEPFEGGSQEYRAITGSFPWLGLFVPHKFEERGSWGRRSDRYVPQLLPDSFEDVRNQILSDFEDHLLAKSNSPTSSPSGSSPGHWCIDTPAFDEDEWYANYWDEDLEHIVIEMINALYVEFHLALRYKPALMPRDPDRSSPCLDDLSYVVDEYGYCWAESSNYECSAEATNMVESQVVPWWRKRNMRQNSLRRR